VAIISNAVTIADAGAFSASLGDMTLIKTITVSSAAGTVSFVDGASSVVLDDTYPLYKFEFINIHPGTNDKGLEFNVSIDTGSNYNVAKTTTFFRNYNYENGNERGIAYQAGLDLANGTGFQPLTEGGISSDNDCSFNGALVLFSPSDTTFVKHFMGTFSMIKSAAGGLCVNSHLGGYVNTTSAVDAVQFKMNAGNIDSGIIKLYGIKDS